MSSTCRFIDNRKYSQKWADIHDTTLDNWVIRAAEALEPIKQAAKEQIPIVHVLQSGETKVKILKPSKQDYFWRYHGQLLNWT